MVVIKLPRQVLCLDWDKRSLRMVVARVGRGPMRLEDAHSHRLPQGVDADDPAALGAFIRQMLEKHRWKHTRVIVDVPRDKAVINRLTLPPTPADELAAAVRFQAAKELPFALDEAAMDFVVLRREERGLAIEVLLAAVRTETLERIKETCRHAGLTTARVGLRPYANLLSLTHLAGMGAHRVLFVDVGPTKTEIDVCHNGMLLFSRSADVNITEFGGGAPVATDSMIASLETATAAPADAETERCVQDLLVETTRTFQAYRATDPAGAIDRIVIAGVTGLERPLCEALEKRFGVPAVLFDPSQMLEIQRKDAPKLRSFSAVLGLAWGLGAAGLLELDFVNPKKPVPRQASLKRRLRLTGLAATAVLVGVAGVTAKLYRDQSTRLSGLNDEIAGLTQQVKALRELENRVKEAEEWRVDAVWLDHLLRITQSAVEPGKQMLARQMTFDERTAMVTMKLVCANWQIPAEFIKRVNELTVGGKQPYRAAQGTWREAGTGDADFQGTVDARVELLPLLEHLKSAKDRDKARKARVKKF